MTAKKLLLVFCSAAIISQSRGTGTGDIRQNADISKSGYYVIGGKTYYINDNNPLNWYSAIDACNDLGMALVSIEDSIEQENLVSFLDVFGFGRMYFWTSLHYFSDVWLWTGSGQLLGTSFWFPGEPDNTTLSCVSATLHQGYWQDEACTADTWYYICE